MRKCISRGICSPIRPLLSDSLHLPKFNHLLRICSTAESVRQGKQAHQKMIVHGYGDDQFAMTKLIQMYADCDDMISSRILFEKVPNPNVFAWTSILSFYWRNGMLLQCLQKYVEMKCSGVSPDHHVYPKILKACSLLSPPESRVSVHGEIIILGYETDLHVCNSLIHMYLKRGDLPAARKVFDGMVVRDILSWNFMISGYNQCGEHGTAIEMMKKLEGPEPDLVTWNTTMDAYCRLGMCEEARNIMFRKIKKPNIISWTTMISGYSRAGDHESSLHMFREMVMVMMMMTRSGGDDDDHAYPDSDCLCTALLSCRNIGGLNSGREIHSFGMKNDPIGFHSTAGPSLIILYAECGKVHVASRVFSLLDHGDVVVWNAMILGFSHAGMRNRALGCFNGMRTEHDGTTLATVLPLCCLRTGKEIHSHVIRSRNEFGSSTTITNAIIHMYSRNGCVRSARDLFSSASSRDRVTWNTVIGGFSASGDAETAIRLMREMREEGFFPDRVTFTLVLSACSRGGFVEKGLDLLRSMSGEYGIEPSLQHFSCTVDLLARAGRVDEAIDLVSRMPVDPGKAIWGALLAASRGYGDFTVGRMASRHLLHIEPENTGNYVALSDMSCSAGDRDAAVSVRNLMEVRHLVKPCAFSSSHN